MKPIFLDEMRERVGSKLFSSDWIGGSSKEDWDLIKGPYGVKQSTTPTEAGFPSEIAPCPRATASKLDRALGRAIRMNAQYSTVDTWLAARGAQIDARRPHDRKDFNATMRKEFGIEPKVAPAKRGPKSEVLARVIDEIEKDVADGKLTVDQLRKLFLKTGASDYNTTLTSFRDAKIRYLDGYAAAQKVIPRTPKKEK
jgi:hypothetical protein